MEAEPRPEEDCRTSQRAATLIFLSEQPLNIV